MTDFRSMTKFASHVTARTEQLRGKSPAKADVGRVLKASQVLLEAGASAERLQGRELLKVLESALSAFHKIEYSIDSLFSKGLISGDIRDGLISEGNLLRDGLISSIITIRAAGRK